MHKLITGWPLVDHTNGDGLDNRRENLRPATRSQNGANRRKTTATASPYKGVTRYAGDRWRAYITYERRRIHLGCFNTEIEAAREYDWAARWLFGDFAALNLPGDGETAALAPCLGPLTSAAMAGARRARRRPADG